MPAILTQKYRTFLAQNFITALGNESIHAYVFIGHPQQWEDDSNVAVSDSNPPVPRDDFQTSDFAYWRDMLGAKKVSSLNTQFVIPRLNWTSGTTYDQYDDVDTGLLAKNFYVVDTTAVPYKVYKCLWNNKGGFSTVSPSVIGTALTPQVTTDNYVWQYMFTIGSENYRFLTNRWMPVLSDSSVQTNALNQAGKLPTAVPLVVVNGGSNYNPAQPTTTTIVGDGTGAVVTSNGVSLIGGSVSAVQLAAGGLGYTEVESVNVFQTGAATASIRVIIPPYPNHGYDPIKELGGRALMAIAQFEETEIGKLTVDNNFRRVGLLVNPKEVGGNAATSDFYRQTTDITISANTGVLQPDDVITNITKTTKPTGVVVDVILVANNYVVRLTQVDDKGESAPFELDDTIKCLDTSVEATVSSADGPELSYFSGQVVFINQRTPVTRQPDQIEEVKIVFPFV